MAEQLLTGDEQINEGRLFQLNLHKCRLEIGCLLLANSGKYSYIVYAAIAGNANSHSHSHVAMSLQLAIP